MTSALIPVHCVSEVAFCSIGASWEGDVAGWPHPQPTQVSGVRGKDPLSSSRATSLLILNPGRLAETGVNRVGVPAPWGLQPLPAIHH